MAFLVDNPGGCLLQSRWDFADTPTHGKWSQYHQVYRHLYHVPPLSISDSYDTGTELVITKNKIRGRGRALKLRLKAEPDKDMVIVGWQISTQGNNAE